MGFPRAVGRLCLAAAASVCVVSAAVTANRAPVGGGSRLLAGLTLHDRIAQLIVVRGYGDYPVASNAEYRRFLGWIKKDRVGGFIVAGRIRNGNVIGAAPFEMAAFINHMQRLARTPLLVG